MESSIGIKPTWNNLPSGETWVKLADMLYQQIYHIASLDTSKVDALSLLEVECRLGTYYQSDRSKQTKFNSSISFAEYDRIMTYCNSRKDMLQNSMTVSDNYYDEKTNDRSSKLRRRQTVMFNGNTEWVWQRKSNIKDIDDHNYSFRTSFNYEQVVNIENEKSKVNIYSRTMSRHTYTTLDGCVRIDLSKVVSSDGENGRVPRSPYEIEIELLCITRNDMNILNLHITKYINQLHTILNIIRDTDILYTVSEKYNFIKLINSKLSLYENTNDIIGPNSHQKFMVEYRKPDQIDRRHFTEARNLRIKDLVVGGIVGGKYLMNVAFKTDGKRCILCFCNFGAWLFFPPFEYRKISNTTSDTFTMFDGELIPMENRYIERGAPQNKYWFQVIDVMFKAGNDFRFKDYSTRRQNLPLIIDSIEKTYSDIVPNLLCINTKTTIDLTSPTQMFNDISTLLLNRSGLLHHDDGLIFTPVNNGYYTILNYDQGIGGDENKGRVDLLSRNLTIKPDVCKWKPPTKLTIDFMVSNNGEGIKLTLTDNNLRGDKIAVPFTGTKEYPFDQNSDMLDKDHPLTANIVSPIVVEYAWNYDLKKLYPVKYRNDKSGSNKYTVGMDVWTNIMSPITEDMICNNNYTLFKYTHSNIKRKLLYKAINIHKQNTNIVRELQDQPNGVLLDLGSGNGGDILKWRNFRKIIAIEPDKDKIEEFYRRLSYNNMLDRVHYMACGGQEYHKIIPLVNDITHNDGVDIITMNDSLTFFWSDVNVFNGLIYTIMGSMKKGGLFVWKTLDGDTVREMLQPTYYPVKPQTSIVLGRYKITLINDGVQNTTGSKKIETYFPDTIVGRQIEYLTKMSDLQSYLNYNVIQQGRLDREDYFMSDVDLKISSLYTVGIWQSTGDRITSIPLSSNYRDAIVDFSKYYTHRPQVIRGNVNSSAINTFGNLGSVGIQKPVSIIPTMSEIMHSNKIVTTVPNSSGSYSGSYGTRGSRGRGTRGSYGTRG